MSLGADLATSHYPNQWWLDYRRIHASLGLREFNEAQLETSTNTCHLIRSWWLYMHIYVTHGHLLSCEMYSGYFCFRQNVGVYGVSKDALFLHIIHNPLKSWWRHQMETFSALLALYTGIYRSSVNQSNQIASIYSQWQWNLWNMLWWNL